MEEEKMRQQTLTDMEYGNRKKKTKREEFVETMDEIVPWKKWIEIIRPHYPSGKRGRPVKGIETMLRMYLLQVWFNLSDEGVEDAIYDSYAFRKFMGIDFLNEQAPDATTLLKFRHMLEEHNLCNEFFKEVNQIMEATGHIMHGGTIVDATIIDAPSSTKNKDKKRDSEMHQTKKGNVWRFGMKCHIGVDEGTGIAHTITATPANVHDICEASKLFREDDYYGYGDSGYIGIEKRDEVKNDEHLSKIKFYINRRPKSLPKVSDNAIDWERYIEKRKSSVRCKVEHAFKIIKDTFGFRKVRYKGIAKNLNKLNVLFACANLLMVKRVQKDFKPVVG